MDSFWEFFWFMVVTFFFVAYLMVMFQIVVDIFRDRSSSGLAKAAWLIGLIFLPVLVALIYLISKGQGMAERQVTSSRAAQESSEAYIRSVASAGGGSAADEIARAKSLLDQGAISAEEFAQLKAKALNA